MSRQRVHLPLVTARLLLRPFVAGDLAPLLGIVDHPAVRAQLPDEPHAIAAARRAAAGQRRISAQVLDYAVVARRSGRLVGACELVFGPRASAEIGYLLGRRHWGHGYGTELVRALVAYAFDGLFLQRLRATVAPDNVRSVAVLQHAGFVRDPTSHGQRPLARAGVAADRYVRTSAAAELAGCGHPKTRR